MGGVGDLGDSNNMKRKTVISRAIVVIVVAVMFSGCVEMHTPQPKYIRGDVILSTDGAIWIILDYNKTTDRYDSKAIDKQENKWVEWSGTVGSDDRAYVEKWFTKKIDHVDPSTIISYSEYRSSLPKPTKYNVTIDTAIGEVFYSIKSDSIDFVITFKVTNHESKSTPALKAEIDLTQPRYELGMYKLCELGEIGPRETKIFMKSVYGGYSDYEDYNPFKYTHLMVSVYDPSHSYPQSLDTKYAVIDSAI